MTPFEKAAELIEKMSLGTAYKKIYEGASIETFINQYCFRCAYIAAEELELSTFDSEQKFWIDVKNEIINISKRYM
jgi:hypothetical protein